MNWLYLGLIGYALGTAGVYSRSAGLRLVTEVAKGTVLFCVCTLVFGSTGWYLAFSFVAYAAGRRFPVYRRLKGDAAVQAGASFLLCIVVQSAARGDFPWELLAITLVVAASLAVTRAWQIPLVATAFLAGVLLPLAEGWGAFSPAAVIAAAYIVAETVLSIVTTSLLVLGQSGEIKLWRILARPFALLFLVIDILVSRQALLIVIGIVALLFIVTDFVRLATKISLSVMFKKKEANRFSSMTLFLVSAFLSFLLFPSTIPYVSLVCITFGDLFSKIIGMRFGTVKLYKSRTVQGTLAFLAGSLIFNSIAAQVFDISIVYVAVGCVIASITELFSEAIDDNFSVSILTGGVLSALRYFVSL